VGTNALADKGEFFVYFQNFFKVVFLMFDLIRSSLLLLDGISLALFPIALLVLTSGSSNEFLRILTNDAIFLLSDWLGILTGLVTSKQLRGLFSSLEFFR